MIEFQLSMVLLSGMETQGDDDMTDSEKLDLLIEKVSTVENKVTNIELVVENEIRVNIQRVAEGHLD